MPDSIRLIPQIIHFIRFYYLELSQSQTYYTMKKRSPLIVIAILILLGGIFAFRTNDDQEQASIIIVRAFLVPNGNLSKMEIYRGDARVEEVKLANLRADSQQLNWQAVTTALNKLRNEGYQLASCSVSGEVTVTSTYIFS